MGSPSLSYVVEVKLSAGGFASNAGLRQDIINVNKT